MRAGKALPGRSVSEPARRRGERDGEQFFGWQTFYREVFGVRVPPTVAIPPRRRGFERLIVVARGLTLNRVYEACAKRFACSRFCEDLDRNVRSERTARANYAKWVRGGTESDKELSGLSADDLAKKKFPTVTLLEHLLHELKHFHETESHLDVADITMCAGSRYADGKVPTTIFGKGEFRIHWCSPTDRFPRLRARRIIPDGKPT